RWKLFDCEWDGGRDKLVGQEEVQARVYRILGNFVREGRVNKLILLHGPNGSAKSTFVSCLVRALEYYSATDDGALYRFNWIFPSAKVQRGGGIGFEGRGYDPSDSYANLEEELVDAKLIDELRDHPLLLIPSSKRRDLIAEKLGAAGGETSSLQPSDYILYG